MNHAKNTNSKDSLVQLEPNVEKIIAAIYFVIVEANARAQIVTQYDIVKTLFLADRKHLNDYGRPITFDNYCAMTHGPVPSLAYDLLKENARTLTRLKIRHLPWHREQRGAGKYIFHVNGKAKHSTDCLSQSDGDALLGALTTIKSLSFSQIRSLTHNDKAYVQAWSDDGGRSSYPMNFAWLFETPDVEAARALSFLSRHQ